MFRRNLLLLVCALTFRTAFGQPAAAQEPTFEVASVRAAPQGQRPGGEISADPSLLRATNVTLQDLLIYAYNVRAYQIDGPSWLSTNRYSIIAKIPSAAPRASVRLMLQSLLSERFGLMFHRAIKDFVGYELTVAKNGPKLKAADQDLVSSEPRTDINRAAITFDKDGLPVLPAGTPNIISVPFRGHLHMVARDEPLSILVKMLGLQLRKPLMDNTNLADRYDFTLDFAFGDPAGPLDTSSATAADDGANSVGAALDSQNSAPNLVIALREQLGLKLAERRGPLEILVIDRAEKVPTGN